MSAARMLLEHVPGALPAARRARQMLVRLLHPARRLAARRRLARLRPVRHVVVLCQGNVCRSPYGEAALRRLLSQGGDGTAIVESAGFLGPGRPPPPFALESAARRGLDLSAHRSRLVTRDVLADADLVVVMSPRQGRRVRHEFGMARQRVVVLGDLDPWRASRREIRDPEGKEAVVFRESYDRIDRCLAELARLAGGPAVEPNA